MKMNAKQITELIELTVETNADDLGCDGCYELLDLFAQCELDGNPISDSLQQVREHLVQCKCCRDEYDALLTAIREIEE